MCQGVIPAQQASFFANGSFAVLSAPLGSSSLKNPNLSAIVFLRRKARTLPSQQSYAFSTTVLLTLFEQKTSLCRIDHCPTPEDRRKSIESTGMVGVYRLKTGSETELLDIGVQRDRVPPGLYYASEAPCHVDSR
jgi:hypothetical protein